MDYDTDVNDMNLAKKSLKTKQQNLKNLGMGDFPNAAEFLTLEEENKIWDSLDINTPEGLQDAMWLVMQKHCALRGNESARKLKWGDVVLKEDHNKSEFLEFSERSTKTRSGQNIYNNRAYKPCLFATPAIPERCPVNLYKMFRSHRPQAKMSPESNFYISINFNRVEGSQVWYKNSNLGEKMLNAMMQRMCSKAGVTGKKTNHSWRKTTTQRLINSGMPPAYIKQLTGHKNISSLERYGTASRAIQETMSDIVATGAMEYQNPLAQLVGRRAPAPQALGAPPAAPQALGAPPLAPQALGAPPLAPQALGAPPAAPQALGAPPLAPQALGAPPPAPQPLGAQPAVGPLALAMPPTTTPTVPQIHTGPPALPATHTMPNGNPTFGNNPLPMLFQGATITGNPSITINYNCMSQQKSQQQFQSRPERKRINVIESDSDSD